jgi:arsenite methyltransferase
MKTIQVFDKPMCCSTGICGPQVDPVLPRFASDLDWLKAQGQTVERYNLAQQPQAFVQNAEIHNLLAEQGVDVLPVIVVDGRIVSRQGYPSREMLAMWAGASLTQPSLSGRDRSSGS